MSEKFTLRKAMIDDMMKVFELSNDTVVRQNSINQEQIELGKHQIWFKKKISDSDCLFYIIEVKPDVFWGYVRLDKDENNWITTIHIKQEYRGKGYGAEVMNRVVDLNRDKHIIALVKEENLSSYYMFKKAGFKKADLVTINNDKLYKLELKKDEYNSIKQ